MKKGFVLFSVMALVFAFAATAMANDWSFYGSARMTTFYESNSEEVVPTKDDGDYDTAWDLQANSRFGAKIKGDAVGGALEVGIRGDGQDLYSRLIYGTWNFGGGELLVGQTYTPLAAFYSDQAWGSDEGLLSLGDLYGGRKPMIQLSSQGFKIALIKPSSAGSAATDDVDTTLPKVEVSYHMAFGMVEMDFFGGYNTFEVDKLGDAGDYDVDSYAGGFGFILKPDPVYIRAKIYLGRNVGNYGLASKGNCRFYDATNDEDSDSLGGIFVVGAKVGDTVNIQGGVGYQKHEVDKAEDDVMAYYLQANITLAKGFFIVPEIGMIDYMENDTTDADEGYFTYFGAKWQMNF